MADVNSLVSQRAETGSSQPRTVMKKHSAVEQKIIDERAVRRVYHPVHRSMGQLSNALFTDKPPIKGANEYFDYSDEAIFF